MQIYGRAVHRFARPRPDLAPAPPRRVHAPGRWVEPAPRPMSLVGPGTFRFLGETHALADHGWDDPRLEKLWRYNLHYFDHLLAPATPEAYAWQRELLVRWTRENPPTEGSGWEPFPLSLRIVNWIKWSLAGNTLPPECETSLAVQCRWLTKRLEHHLLGNHLFANAKALVFGGLYFAGHEADRWFGTGLRILRREVPEQILADGGQFERTTMYHALALEDMLDLVNVTRAYRGALPPGVPGDLLGTIAQWPARIEAMIRWLAALSHPDGEIAFFNDAAIGIAPPPLALYRYAARLGIDARPAPAEGTTVLAPSGYVRLAHGDAVAMIDVAPVGPDYLPGHAHADTLSFELSLFGHRVLVNSGTSVYGTSDERLRQRGTAAHNTVVVDGENSSEVWSGFRVARRARPVAFSVDAPRMSVRCGHDGYRRLAGRVEHHRGWRLDTQRFVVEDHVSGDHATAQARFHLHPAVRVSGENPFVLTLPDGRQATIVCEGARSLVERTTWHPEFGRSVDTHCIVVDLHAGRARTEITWRDS